MDSDHGATNVLLRSAVGGDQRAFASLLEQHTVRLLLAIRRRAGRALRADFDVEDVFQLVASRAWQQLPGFQPRGPGSFYRWLLVIAEHALNDRIKYLDAKGRENPRNLGSALDWGPHGREPIDPHTSIAALAARREAIEKLNRALAELADDRRRLLELHFLEAKSLSSIAAELNLPKSVVWDRLQLALSEVKRSMQLVT